MGGECSFYACMPSKGLLRPGELLAVRRIPGVAKAVTGELDVAAVLARRDEIIHDLDSGMEPWLADRGIELVRERGRLEGERRVRAGDDVLVARKAVVVATGSSALVPDRRVARGGALDEPRGHHGQGGARAARDPGWRRGGRRDGPGVAHARLSGDPDRGRRQADRREEPFASEQVAEALRELGVDLRIGVKATAVRAANGELTVELEDGSTAGCDELLVTIGRRPNTGDIQADTVGLEPGEPVLVDDRMAANDWLYRIGDANGRLLTHMGKYQARVAADVILGKDARTVNDDARSPRVIFTNPQVAAVGHTLDSARQAGLNVRAVEVSTQGNAGASFYGRDAPGTTRLVLDEDRGVIVGATFTGPEVQDFLHAATVAVIGELPLERIAHAVPPFPTRSEVATW